MQSAVYYPPQAPPTWPALYQGPPPDYPTPPPDAPFHDPQVDSSIGPRRVLTRRQRAALEHAPLTRRVAGQPQPYDGSVQHQPSSMYINNSPLSRPQTPPNHDSFQAPREGLAIHMPAGSLVQPSPTYHPLTPSSASTSPYSTYGFYSTTHSRSNSISNSTNPRSASPALSTASALTSVSSSGSGSAPNSFAFPAGPATAIDHGKQKKQRLFNVDRKDICLFHKQNPNARQEDIARIYGVERSTISKILKNKTKWLNVPADENLRIAKHRPSKFPEIEEEMVKWLLECRDTNTVLSDSMIRNKAKEIARDLGIAEERFKASSGWIENFKHRHGVRAGVWTGDGKNVRAARALGLGPPLDDESPLLSPLSTGFTDTDAHDTMMGGVVDQSPLSSQSDGSGHAPPLHMDAATEQSPWLLVHPAETAPLSAPPPPPTQQPLTDSSQHQASYGTCEPTVYDVVYERSPPETTTLPEAEDAINKVINFLDTQGQGILQPNERNMLTTIKCALFQAANGLPYDRSTIPYEQGESVAR